MYSYKTKNNQENKSKYKYTFNSQLYELEIDKNRSASFDEKVGVTRADPNIGLTFPDKIKSNSSFTLEKINKKDVEPVRNISLTTKKK